MSMSERLRIARKNKGLTQRELGKAIGKSAQVISNWERNYTLGITQDDLLRLSNALNVSTGYLLDGNDTLQPANSPQTTDLLDALFHDEPELLAKARRIDIKGKINEPGVVATLTEHQKARLKDIIMFTIDEAIRNGRRTLVRIHSSKEGGGGHASPQSS